MFVNTAIRHFSTFISKPNALTQQTSDSVGIIILARGDPACEEDLRVFCKKTREEVLKYNFYKRWLFQLSTKSAIKACRKYSPQRLIANERGKLIKSCLQAKPMNSQETYNVYVCFELIEPLLENSITEAINDGMSRIVVFVQNYFSDLESRDLYKKKITLCKSSLSSDVPIGLLLDWGNHPFVLEPLTDLLHEGLNSFDLIRKRDAVILFSSRPTPHALLKEGDTYIQNHCFMANSIMKMADLRNPFHMAWNIPKGFEDVYFPPSLPELSEYFVKSRHPGVLHVPIDNSIENLVYRYISDIHMADRFYAKHNYENFFRCSSPNLRRSFVSNMVKVMTERIALNQLLWL